jgi:Fe2+ transport system protein FeoA
MISGKLYTIKNTTNSRLSAMGLITGTTVRVVKRVVGMIQLKLNNSFIVIREELLSEIEYEEINE